MASRASVGTLMYRKYDVLRVIHGKIKRAHEECAELGEQGKVGQFMALRRKIAGWYEILNEMENVPIFENASAIEARKGRDATRLDGESHDSASDAQTIQPE